MALKPAKISNHPAQQLIADPLFASLVMTLRNPQQDNDDDDTARPQHVDVLRV